MRLADSHVLVTGASRGIGAALAREAARRGAHVTLVARTAGDVEVLARELGGTPLPADLGDAPQRAGLVARAEAAAGRPVDVLANVAGVEGTGSLLGLSAEQLSTVLTVNLLAPAELVRQALPGMVARGRGHVVNVSSGYSTINTPGLTPYCASKAGLSHFTSGVVAELRGTGVGTTLVEPGPVGTDMWDRLHGTLPYGALRRFTRLRLARVVDPAELARATCDKVEAGGGHVVLPKRMTPVVAFTWAPRRLADVVMSGVPRR